MRDPADRMMDAVTGTEHLKKSREKQSFYHRAWRALFENFCGRLP
jgi:hypothetical protein